MATKYSYVTYNGDGNRTDYIVPFPYIDKADVFVTVDGINVPFAFINASAIRCTTAPTLGASVQVLRHSNKAAAPVNFSDGSVLLEKDLDTLTLWTLYIAQEDSDTATDIKNGLQGIKGDTGATGPAGPVGPMGPAGPAGTGGGGGVIVPPVVPEVQPFYPYALTYDGPPATQNFTVTLPRMVAQFGTNQVIVAQTAYQCPASRIVDVWLKPDGTYLYSTCALSDYWQLPRYDTYIHVARLQSSVTKVQGIYLRRPTSPLRTTPVARPFTDYHFKNFHIIPSTYQPWVNMSAMVSGFVYRTSTGDLYMCEESGTCEIEPAQPTYNEELNSGFSYVMSGTATLSFRGRSTYSGAWRVSPRAGITWYFSHLSAGLMADRFPTEVLQYLKTAAFHIVDNWVSGSAYTEGRKVAGPLTKGWAWEAQSAGTATATNPFPATGVAIGTTVTDGTITWRAIGPCAHPEQKFFWYDAEPTMRGGKSPDSHDSYAACWIWAIWKYLKATNNTAWLDQPSPHDGYTYSQLMKEVIYSNLSTQVGTNKLTKTFQGDGVPFGGSYAASFFMDNCEVWAGFYAAFQIYSTFHPDSAYALSMSSYSDTIRQGLEALWEPATGTYKYVDGLVSMAPPVPGNALFYPLCMSQAWGQLWGVPLNPNRTAKCFTFMQANYPYWWARNDVDDLLALGAHYAYASYTGNSLVKRQIIERVEEERLSPVQADLYVMDAAYYMSMRDIRQVKHLCA